MCSLESFKIDLKGLKESEVALEYDLDESYFGAIDGSEVSRGCVHVSLSVRKASDFFDFDFHTEGTVVVACDRCLDDMDQPISADNHLTVRFGSTYSEEDDQVTVDEREGVIDVSWFIYEFIVLAIPIQHVHETGKCNNVMMQALEEHTAARSSDGESTEAVDPRWAKLKDLKI